jgi:hypothetical protein
LNFELQDVEDISGQINPTDEVEEN